MGKSKNRAAKKKPKLEIVFDKEARNEFLSGFHKRKLQKKEFYKTKLEKRLKEEKQRIRAEAKKSVGRASSSHSILPEVEKIIGMTQADLEDELKTKSESFTLGSKTITISSLDDIHIKPPPLEDSDDEESDKGTGAGVKSDDEESHPNTHLSGNIKTSMKKAMNSLLQNSKVFKTSQRLKQKGKKSFIRRKNRLAKAGKGSAKEGAEGPRTSSKQQRGKAKELNPKSKKGKRARYLQGKQ